MGILDRINTWARNKYGTSQEKFHSKGARLNVTTVDPHHQYSIYYAPKITAGFDSEICISGLELAQRAIKGDGPLRVNQFLYLERYNIVNYNITLDEEEQTLLGRKEQNVTLVNIFNNILGAFALLAWISISIASLAFLGFTKDAALVIVLVSCFGAPLCLIPLWLMGIGLIPDVDEDGNLKR